MFGKLTRLSMVLGLAWLLGPSIARAQRKNPDGMPVLIVSGGQREHHGYREQAADLAALLEATGRYRVTIVEDASILDSPALAKYRIAIGIADRRDPEFHLSEAQQQGLLNFVKSGNGYVSIHGADNAPEDWLPEMKDMLGGIFSHYGQPDGRAINGTYEVMIPDPSHPIVAGLSDFTLKDELYTNLQMRPDVVPLATIDHEGTTWPVAWTYTYGSGKVFHTPLGHKSYRRDHPDPLRDPNLSRLVLQGIDWVADSIPETSESP